MKRIVSEVLRRIWVNIFLLYIRLRHQSSNIISPLTKPTVVTTMVTMNILSASVLYTIRITKILIADCSPIITTRTTSAIWAKRATLKLVELRCGYLAATATIPEIIHWLYRAKLVPASRTDEPRVFRSAAWPAKDHRLPGFAAGLQRFPSPPTRDALPSPWIRRPTVQQL